MYDNVFILGTGRCGTMTFTKACQHITNYTAGHETRTNQIWFDRVNYPANHIEADNRLVWFLPYLEKWCEGKKVLFVHLIRHRTPLVDSLAKRFHPGSILFSYLHGILLETPSHTPNLVTKTPQDIAASYVDLVYAHLEFFKKHTPHNNITPSMESMKSDHWALFWELIGAEGNFDAALAEWDVKYNAS